MGAHKEVLIVDGDPKYRTIIDLELKAAGYQTVIAQNAEEALVALWENKKIGLVLLDVRLAAINGFDIFEIIRKKFPNKKIIITSILHKAEQQILLYEADDYYDKSQNLTKLIDKIDNMLNFNSMKGASIKNDKRNFKRIPAIVLAICMKEDRYTSPNRVHFVSHSIDLSPYGGRFIIDEDIEAGQHFTMALELPVNFLPLLIDCEVVWVKKTEGSAPKTKENIEVGVRFVNIDSCYDEKEGRHLKYGISDLSSR